MAKGTIRTLAGLIIVLGAVGGAEHSVDNSTLLTACLVALAGIALMYSGVKAINKHTRNTLDALYK